jgi:MYXO-CTERM domain-containing protein
MTPGGRDKRWSAPALVLLVFVLWARVAHALPATYEAARRQAEVLANEQKWDQLMEMLTHLDKLAVREHGPDSEQVITARFRRAKLLHARGRHDEAIAVLGDSIALMDATEGSFEARIAEYHRMIAEYHGDAGRLRDKQAMLTDAVARLKKAQFAGRAGVLVETMTNLSAASLELGQIDRAKTVAEEAVAIARADKGDAALAIGPLTTLGAAQHWAWEFRGSLQSYATALELATEHLGDNDPTTGTIAYQMAAVHSQTGDAVAAIASVERALRIFVKVHGEMSVQVAAATLNLGGQWLERGDPKQALTLSKSALVEYEKILGPETVHRGHANLIVGRAYRAMGRWRETQAALGSALGLFEKHYGPSHSWTAYALEQLAELELLRGAPDAASALATRALAIRTATEGAESPGRSAPLEQLGRAAIAERDGASALRYLAPALKLRRGVFGDVNPDVARTRCSLAIAHALDENHDDALEQQRQCDDTREELMQHALSAGSDAQKRRYLDALDVSTNQAVAMHLTEYPKDVTATALALTSVLRRKGRALDVMAAQYGVARGLDGAQRAMFDELTTARTRLATLLYAGAGADVVDEARRAATRLERKIADRTLVAHANVGIAAVQAALPDDAVLVEFTVFGEDQLTTVSADPAQRSYAAYVLGKRGPPRAVRLGSERDVNRAVDALRVAMSSPERDPGPASRALHSMAFAPLQPLLAGATRVFIAADGKLSLVPFAALVDGDQPLLRRLRISYLTSGRDLVATHRPAGVAGAPVLVGAPAFGRAPAKATLSFPALPGTAEEIAALDAALDNAKALTGESASEAALKALRAPAILHLATHGFFLPAVQGPAASTDRRGVTLTSLPEVSRVDPWLHSGMALAGANHRGGEEDGLLSAYEAATLDLDGTKLVVLSACDTGVGSVTRGEGVLGLRRAFVMAGAETVVMSLWRVDDASTRDLMLGYYARLKQGAGRADAMRDAQLALLDSETTAHPFFWAAFIVEGDPSPIYADAAVPEVPPSARGCGCSTPGGDATPGAWLLGPLWLALALARQEASTRGLEASPQRTRGRASSPP